MTACLLQMLIKQSNEKGKEQSNQKGNEQSGIFDGNTFNSRYNHPLQCKETSDNIGCEYNISILNNVLFF